MSFSSILQRLAPLYVAPASQFFRAFIGVMIVPLLLVVVVGRDLVTLGHPGIFWGTYVVSLLLLAALGFGSRMYRRNAYQGKGLSISPTYKSKGWG